MTTRTKKKIAENTQLLCRSLSVPYTEDLTKAATDQDFRHQMAIMNALIWTAEDVEAQAESEPK